MRLRGAAAALVAACVCAPATAAPVLLDGVAAVVDRRVITRTEVFAEGRMVLVNRAGSAGLNREVDARFMDSILDYLIIQELLVQEARRSGAAVSEGVVDRRLATFRSRFDDEGQYQAFLLESGVDEEAVRAVLRRDLAIEELVDARTAQAASVSDVDVEAYRRDNPAAVAELKPLLADQAIRQTLEQRRRRAAFEALVTDLRSRTEVRRVASFIEEAQAEAHSARPQP